LLLQVDDKLKKIYNINNPEIELLKIIESPVVPTKPHSPKKLIVVTVAFVSSLFLLCLWRLLLIGYAQQGSSIQESNK